MIPACECPIPIGAFIFGAAVGAFIAVLVIFSFIERAARRHRP